MDRKPMLLVSTASTSDMGNVATRRKRGRTTDEPPTYEFDQPLMHSTYRRYFNAVDLFNRDALGQQSLQFAFRSRSWYRRMFMAILGFCETNALMAYRYEVGPCDRYEWLAQLSHALLNNSHVRRVREDEAGLSNATGNDLPVCCNLHYVDYSVKCSICRAKTHWYCGCGVPFCNPGTSDKQQRGPWYFKHLQHGVLRRP